MRYFDDRSQTEKIMDWIDKALEPAPRIRRRPFLTRWVDKLGNSSEKIRESEKKGYAYMSEREWDQMASSARRNREAEEKKRFKKKVEFAVSEIKKGRKYTQEWGRVLEQVR